MRVLKYEVLVEFDYKKFPYFFCVGVFKGFKEVFHFDMSYITQYYYKLKRLIHGTN